jgi:hypothetical protein
VRGRRLRRRKQLLDGINETRGYCKIKDEALDCTLWGSRFGKGNGPVARQTKELINSFFHSFNNAEAYLYW